MRHTHRVGLALGLLLGLALSFALPSLASRNGSGTYSLPSGNPVVTGTTISSTWANTTLSDLASEMTNSLDRQGRGAMTGALQLAAGTSSAPGLTFSAETNSGLYRAASNDFRFQVAASTVDKVTAQARTITSDTVVTAGSANGTALLATGSGVGWGVRGVGGNGIDAGASSRGIGGYFSAGTYATAGVRAEGSTDHLPGLQYGGPALLAVADSTHGGNGAVVYGGATLDGGQAGAAVYAIAVSAANLTGTGGAGVDARASNGYLGRDGGTGVYAVGGSNGGAGVEAIGGTDGPGARLTGGGRAAGAVCAAGTASSGGTRYTALQVANGDIDFDGVTAPSSTTAMKNKLSVGNLPAAWGYIDPGASPSVRAGYNIASLSCGANVITVTLAQAFASSDYAVIVNGETSGDRIYSASNTSASAFTLKATDAAGGTVNLCAAALRLTFVAFGAQ